MDAKGAIQGLKVLNDVYGDHIGKQIVECVDVGVEALEKQVPKEPVQKEDSAYGWAWYCPNCGCFIDPSTYKFCQDCGQAIKKE